MKFICLGYIEEGKFESLPDDQRNAMIDECFNYDDFLRKNGHFVGGEALQGPRSGVTLRWQNGKAPRPRSNWAASSCWRLGT
jgi:hypothetical protein